MINKLSSENLDTFSTRFVEAHLGLGEASGGILPVGHIPELVDVVGTDVLVLQVVSVLPNIDTNNWNQTGSGLSKFKN